MLEKIFRKVIKNKPKESFPKQVFHGGCNGCRVQETVGTLICSGCKYHKSNWKLPSFNGSNRRNKIWKFKIKLLSNFVKSSYRDGVIIFHGGCIGCKSQMKHGIKKCVGCQYFAADWSKPNLFLKQ